MNGICKQWDDLLKQLCQRIIYHVAGGLLSIIPIPLEETAIRTRLGPKMASVIRLNMTVVPSDPDSPSPPSLTLHSPSAHQTPLPLKQVICHNH